MAPFLLASAHPVAQKVSPFPLRLGPLCGPIFNCKYDCTKPEGQICPWTSQTGNIWKSSGLAGSCVAGGCLRIHLQWCRVQGRWWACGTSKSSHIQVRLNIGMVKSSKFSGWEHRTSFSISPVIWWPWPASMPYFPKPAWSASRLVMSGLQVPFGTDSMGTATFSTSNNRGSLTASIVTVFVLVFQLKLAKWRL